ncbi:tetratricopeptide repeat protein [Microcoleus sp. FACHB-1515]|nr:tetratricopeptide repeat protein [Microcoleus sp. FACHB-1515]
MIVKNEANQLPRCLDSVRSIVDEAIVLDTGSTDETVSIARSLGAQVQHFTWNNDFAAARNECLKYAQGDWVLVLDADEVLIDTAISAIRQAIEFKSAIVVNLLRQEIGAIQSPYSLVSRLFRRHPAIHFTRPYHAQIDDSVTALLQVEPHWQLMELPEVAVAHYGYDPGSIASQDKFARARAAMEAFLATYPNDAYDCSKLGALYVQQGDLDRGIALLERGLQFAQAAPVRFELHYHLGIACSRRQQFDRAQNHYQLAIAQRILPALKLGAYINLGNLQKLQGDFAAAKTSYEMAIAIDPSLAIAHYNLGLTLRSMGNLVGAIASYQTAISLQPHYADAHQNLAVALLKIGRVSESLANFRRAIELHEQANSPEAKRLRQMLQEMNLPV